LEFLNFLATSYSSLSKHAPYSALDIEPDLRMWVLRESMKQIKRNKCLFD